MCAYVLNLITTVDFVILQLPAYCVGIINLTLFRCSAILGILCLKNPQRKAPP